MHLVEHRGGAGIIRALDEVACQGRGGGRRADRIAQRHPGAAAHAVHDEGRALAVEQQFLVAQPGQVGQGRTLGADDALGVGQRLARWRFGQVRRRPEQA